MRRTMLSCAVLILMSSVAVAFVSPALRTPFDGGWARFDAARLGVSFEHPESMQDRGLAFAGCGTGLIARTRPARHPPRQIFFRASGTGDQALPARIEPGRQMQLAVWLGSPRDGWGLAPLADETKHSPWAFGEFGGEDPIPVRLAEEIGRTAGGVPIRRRIAPGRETVVYRIDGDRDRVIHLRGAIRDGEIKPMKDEELAAFDRVARSVRFAEPRSPETEPCGDWTRWIGGAWSVCVPGGWVESRWPDGLEPSERIDPIPPTRLSFEEAEQRFSLMTRSFFGGLMTPLEERELILHVVASASSRGPYPAEHEGEGVVAGTWEHARRWLREWEPVQGSRLVEARLFTNDAGQTGVLRVISDPSQMREDAEVGPLGVPENSLRMSFSLYAPGRIEHRVSMSAWYGHAEARAVFDRIARSFVLRGPAIEPPDDLPILP